MSHTITMYANDPSIEAIELILDGTVIAKHFYSPTNESMTVTIGGNMLCRFNAIPASNCRFTQWVYRRTSINPSGDAYYDDSNPFDCFVDDNVIIRAEGEETEQEEEGWKTNLSFFMLDVETSASSGVNVPSGTLMIKGMRFSENGKATFYTEGSIDTIGWLTYGTGSGYYEKGADAPYNSLVTDDDSYDGNNFKFTHNVVANTNYYVWIRGAQWDTSGYVTLHVELDADTDEKPTLWTWSASNGEATRTQTVNSEKALKKGTPTTDFHHKVWNDIVKKVNDILVYQGFAWDGRYASYDKTRMTADSDKKLTAVRYNSVVYNIDRFIRNIPGNYFSGLSTVKQGDALFASHITQLTEEINWWIPAL